MSRKDGIRHLLDTYAPKVVIEIVAEYARERTKVILGDQVYDWVDRAWSPLPFMEGKTGTFAENLAGKLDMCIDPEGSIFLFDTWEMTWRSTRNKLPGETLTIFKAWYDGEDYHLTRTSFGPVLGDSRTYEFREPLKNPLYVTTSYSMFVSDCQKIHHLYRDERVRYTSSVPGPILSMCDWINSLVVCYQDPMEEGNLIVMQSFGNGIRHLPGPGIPRVRPRLIVCEDKLFICGELKPAHHQRSNIRRSNIQKFDRAENKWVTIEGVFSNGTPLALHANILYVGDPLLGVDAFDLRAETWRETLPLC